MKYIDSHLHLDHILNNRPEWVDWMQEKAYFPVSWAFAKQVGSVSDVKNYLAAKVSTVRELNHFRLPCRFLAGIHPRNIVPELKPESVRELILPCLEMPLCLGIGEIGLETAGSHETEVLQAQLELFKEVADLDKVYGIHTPRANKAAVTRKTLDMLTDYEQIKDRIVVDHCLPETIGDVLSSGVWAGITISPTKASEADVRAMISRYEDHIPEMMMNTDSGASFYEDLYQFSRLEDIDTGVRESLTRSNAARFFRLPIY
ncbi:MAG: TatD family hydrolase [Desulfobacterales bacterium]|nr:TatD family hydrolase [Desulfobacterales bacterium]